MNCTGWDEMQRNAGWVAVLLRDSKKKRRKKKKEKKEDSTVHAIKCVLARSNFTLYMSRYSRIRRFRAGLGA